MGVDGISNKVRVQRVVPAQRPAEVAPVDKELTPEELARAREAVGGERSSSSGGVGAGAALRGLDVVKPKKKRMRWTAALATAMIGISALTGMAPQQAQAMETRPQTVQTMLRVQQPRGPPPTQIVVDSEKPTQADKRVFTLELPDTLLSLASGARVTHGTDPGDFYCEHAFFTSTTEALRHDTSILKNEHGEVLTGFLHVPSDELTYDSTKAVAQSERHKERRDIVGAAIRGYWEQARSQLPDGTFRMLLTGYGSWESVVNNPSGDFTAHKENIDAAMLRAFGDSLVSTSGTVLRESENGDAVVRRISYGIRDPITGAPSKVIIEAVRLPVTDDAINHGPRSLQTRIGDFRPHAVMSMGVAPGTEYKAEFHADDGGLVVKDGTQAHDGSQSMTRAHADNRSLARAIHIGGKASVPTSTVQDPNV